MAIFSVASVTAVAATSHAQSGYTKVNLVSNRLGFAPYTDTRLVNAWGLVSSLSGSFYVADNGTGLITQYRLSGTPSSFAIEVPSPSSPSSSPTGLVINTSDGFRISQAGRDQPATVLMVGEDGTIAGWNANVSASHAVLAVDRSSGNAVYKGLATGRVNGSVRLYATDFFNARVDVLDENFAAITTPGQFIDPTIPAGYAPFGIANLNGFLYVSYALQEGPKNKDDEPGLGHGFISIFKTDGTFVKQLLSHGELNSPWGMVIAPSGFGQFGSLLFVGNFGDGRINVYNPDNGGYHGALHDASGHTLLIRGLWGLAFLSDEGAANGNITEKRLYFTAGPGEEQHGVFGYLYANG